MAVNPNIRRQRGIYSEVLAPENAANMDVNHSFIHYLLFLSVSLSPLLATQTHISNHY